RDQIGRPGGAGDVLERPAGSAVLHPLVGDGVVALAGAGRGGEGLALLGRAGDRRRRDGRRAGEGGIGSAAGRAGGGAVAVGGGGRRLDREALVGRLDQVGRAGGPGDILEGAAGPVVLQPLVGDGVVRIARARRGGEGLALLRRAGDRRRRDGRLTGEG